MDNYDNLNDALDGMAEGMWPEQEEIEMPEINVPPREQGPKFINQTELRKAIGLNGKFRIAAPSTTSQYGHNFPIELSDGSKRILTLKEDKLSPFVAAWGNNTDKWVDRFMVYTGDYTNPQFPNKPSMNLIPEEEEQ